MLEVVRKCYAPTVLARAKNMGLCDRWLSVDDIVNTLVAELLADGCRKAQAAAAAENPGAYVAKVLHRAVQQQWGLRAASLEACEHFISRDTDSGLTPLDEVVSLTLLIISPYVETTRMDDLYGLLKWLAFNPPQRLSYESEDKLTVNELFGEVFNPIEIQAVMRIAWGVRPRESETSIMGRLLLDPDFNPATSSSHSKVLIWFKKQWREAKKVL